MTNITDGRAIVWLASFWPPFISLSDTSHLEQPRACVLTHGEDEVKWMRRGPVGTICAPLSPPPPLFTCPSLLMYSEECIVSCF